MEKEKFLNKIKRILNEAQKVDSDAIILDWINNSWRFNTSSQIDENYIKNMIEKESYRRKHLLRYASILTNKGLRENIIVLDEI